MYIDSVTDDHLEVALKLTEVITDFCNSSVSYI
jgi:hypothetical protein